MSESPVPPSRPPQRLKLGPPPKHQAPHSGEGDEGNWLVSYADMMTLLVGFFVILLSFSVTDQEKLERIKQSVAKEFGGSYEVPYGDMANRIREDLKKLGTGENFVVKQTPVGVDISIMGTVFFDTGSASIRDHALELLGRLTAIIQTEANQFNVVIEGHTDDTPVGANLQYRTNWELSSVRACRVLDIFESKGFKKTQLTAVGYADSQPIVPNRTAAGAPIPENQSQNRRVIIKLIKPGEPSIGPAETKK